MRSICFLFSSLHFSYFLFAYIHYLCANNGSIGLIELFFFFKCISFWVILSVYFKSGHSRFWNGDAMCLIFFFFFFITSPMFELFWIKEMYDINLHNCGSLQKSFNCFYHVQWRWGGKKFLVKCIMTLEEFSSKYPFDEI